VAGTTVERHSAYNKDYEVFYTQLKFTAHLRRKPLFYVVNIVIPFLLLIVVVLMVTSYTEWPNKKSVPKYWVEKYKIGLT